MTEKQATSWRDVPGYEGLYLVSDRGQIKSIGRVSPSGIRAMDRILKASLAGRYPSVNLCKQGKRTTRAIHILVAQAFLGRRPNGMVVAHWDGNVHNAALSNLRYTTPSENEADKNRHGTKFIAEGEKNGHAKLNESQVSEILHRHCVLKETQTSLAKEFGVHQSLISHIKRGVHWKHLAGGGDGI